jgi:hypothetical protein
VTRPVELSFVEDKALGTKTYTYILEVTGTGDSIKRLLNKISGDEQYNYEISSVKLTAEPQVTAGSGDLVPNIKRSTTAATGDPKKGTVPDLDDLERGLEDDDDEPKDEVVIIKDSISPFQVAVNKVVLTVDWIQFVKEAPRAR